MFRLHSGFALLPLLFLFPVVAFSQKISVDQLHVRHVTFGQKNGYLSFDGNTSTAWFPGWTTFQYPARIRIDLGTEYRLNKIRIFDNTGSPEILFYAPTSQIQVLKTTLDQYQLWREFNVNVVTRFVEIELTSVQGEKVAPEIEFYGNLSTDPIDTSGGPNDPPVVVTIPTKAGAKLNVNGFHWVPFELTDSFRYLRLFQMSRWTWTENGVMFEPTASGSGNYDTYYTECKARGIIPIPTVNQTPEFILTGHPADAPFREDFKPVRFGKDPSNPLDYEEFSAYWFQLTARYGRVQYPDSVLTVNTTPRWTNDPPNEKKSGLDLLNIVEVWNEPNKWWADPRANFTPEEYAAMLSACYDGHEGQLGPGHGIKTADPSMQVLMAGLSSIDVDYLDRMRLWFQQHRTDGKFAADILNVHHYCANDGPAWLNGVSPEQNNLRGKIQPVTAWRNTHLPGMEIWYTEFGYDTRPPSPQRADPYGPFNAEQVQAMWVVRCYLEALAAGLDNMFIFNAIDEPSAATGYLFQNSGLAHGEADPVPFSKKPSWTAVTNLIHQLNGMDFDQDVSPNNNVRILKFTGNGKTKWVIWSPTANNTTFPYSTPAGTVTVTEMPLVVTF